MAGLLRMGEQAQTQATGLVRQLANQEHQREETIKNMEVQREGSMLGGAGTGAMIGFQMGGPMGAAIGGISGLFLGGL